MNRCLYCGAEYSDHVLVYPIDHTPLVKKKATPARASTPPAEPERPDHEFPSLSATERQEDLATLVRCGTLMAVDLVVSRLRAAGIEAHVSDERLMQTIGFNLNTFGYVRVQVAPREYAAARELLSATSREA